MSAALEAPAVEPVRPIPEATAPGPLRTLYLVRRDLLSIWSKDAYRMQFFGRRLFNRWMFIANSPDTVEYAFVTRHDIYQRKSPYMRKALKPLLGDGLFVSDGEKWKSRRSLEAPAFQSSNMQQFSDIMINCAVELRERWDRDCAGREIPVLPDMAALTSRIIARAMFGDAMNDERSNAIVRDFSEYQAAVEQFDVPSFFGLPDWWPKLPQWGRTGAAARRIQALVDEMIRERLAATNDDGSLLTMLLRASTHNGGSLTLEQVRNEAIVIFMAGHETTANSLAWTWYLLSLYPDAQARFHGELEQVLGGRTPALDDVAGLRFTRAVFEESMRLYPPIPLLSREAMADDVIRKRNIPKGSIMLVVPWLLHRHELLWESPHQFIPERFLPENARGRNRYSYVPFSTGPRICLGKAFAMTEAILCLAVLGQRFAPSVIPGVAYSYDCRLALRPGNGLPMKLNRRD